MRQTLAVLSVILLVSLAGCSMFTPSQPTTPTPESSTPDEKKAEVINQAIQTHLDASSATVESNISQKITIRNTSSGATVTSVSKRQTKTTFNYTAKAYHTNGTVYRESDGASFTYPAESYYVDGTLYRKVTNQDSIIWRASKSNFTRDATYNISGMGDADTLEHFTFHDYSSENGTYVYTADLTNTSAFNALIEENSNKFRTASYHLIVDNAETFTLTVVVDSDTKTLKEISVHLESQIPNEDLRQSEAFNFSDNAELDNVVVDVGFSSTNHYSKYNSGQTITLPQEIKNATTN